MAKARSFLEFIRTPIIFYKTIGVELYGQRATNVLLSAFMRLYFYCGFIQLNLLALGATVYSVNAIRMSHLLVATAVVPSVGFVLVANYKQVALIVNNRTLHEHLDQLQAIFPADLALQLEYKLPQCERIMKRVTLVFTMLCVILTYTYSLYPANKAAVEYFVLGAPHFEKYFGFLISFPFDPRAGWVVYWLTYVSLMFGSYFAGIMVLSADLLIVASVTQICMHFNYIAKQLEEFDVTGASEADSERFLKRLVRYHAKCLELSEHVNVIFSTSLLLNFLTASLTICCTGFQVITATTENIVKFCIFMLASMVQVFIVCYYGDELMAASLSVAAGAYNQNWYESSIRHRRILLYMMARSQRVASIRAPTFPPISLETFMKIVGMSYQFFTLLRTIYNGN